MKKKLKQWTEFNGFESYIDAKTIYNEIVMDKQKGTYSPTCRGIYLSFLEDLGRNYDEAIFFYPEKQRSASSKGAELYKKMREELKKKRRPKKFNLKIENKYI